MLKMIKLENAYTYFISFFDWSCLYIKILKEKFSNKQKVFQNKLTTSLFEGFKQKEIFFNVT